MEGTTMSDMRRMMMMFTRPVEGGGGGGDDPTPVLPYDAQVEYLQSSGTQYIQIQDVIYNSSNKYVFEGHLNFASNPTTNQYMGWDAGGMIGWVGNKGWFDGYDLSTYISAPYNTDANISLTINSGTSTYTVFSIDGYTSLSRPHSSLTNYAKSNPYTLFGFWSKTTFAKISIRIYDFKVYINDTLAHDLIAVRKNGVGYMYDKVSGKLFGNSGTGSFTYGNDVTN